MSYLIIMIDQSILFTNVADVIYNIMNIVVWLMFPSRPSQKQLHTVLEYEITDTLFALALKLHREHPVRLCLEREIHR